MDLVCYRPPYPDELLYGWLKDLARQNYPLDTKGIQRVLNYVFPYRYPPEKRGFLGREPRPLRMDFVKGLDRGIRQLQQKGYQIADPEDIVTYNTPLVAISVALNKGDQARCIHTAMAEVTGGPFDMPTIHMSVTSIRICPCCMRERPYIRTWHNLPGVEVCAVHGIVLESADERTISGVSRHQTVHGNAEQTEFAKLAKTIYDNPRGLTLQDIKDHLPAETALRSPGEQPFERVLHALLAHHIDYLDITAQQNDTRSTYDGATLLSRTGMISTYRCRKCGTVWTDADEAIRIGFRCPQCIKNVPPDTIISEMLGRIGDGKYKLTKPFFSIGGTQDILHETCGQVTASRLELKVWHGTKCRCEAIHTLDSLQRIVDSYGERCSCRIRIPEAEIRSWVEEHGFELIDYTNASDKMTLLHPACGETFNVVRAQFLTNARCRICEDPRHGRGAVKAISERLQEVVGSEYELLAYDDETKTMTLKHKSCDFTFTQSRNGFFNGQRCPQCTQLPTYRMLAEAVSEASNGRLVLSSEDIPGGSSVNLLNTEDGSVKTLRRAYIAQELSRPTPSALFPERQKEYAFPDWRTYLTLYKDYLSEYGEAPSRKVEYRELPLGVWCMHMRKMRKAGKLTDERIEILSDAGFDWGKSADT